ALAAASAGSADADKLLSEMRANRQQNNDAYGEKILEIRELEVAALICASKRNFDEAVATMKRATSLEEEMSPPSGPPALIKPAPLRRTLISFGANWALTASRTTTRMAKRFWRSANWKSRL